MNFLVAATTTDNMYLAALGGLITVIGVLWKINQNSTQKSEKRSESLEVKYEDANEKLLVLSTKVGKLEGEVELAKGLHPKIDHLTQLTDSVLEAVTENNKPSKDSSSQ